MIIKTDTSYHFFVCYRSLSLLCYTCSHRTNSLYRSNAFPRTFPLFHWGPLGLFVDSTASPFFFVAIVWFAFRNPTGGVCFIAHFFLSLSLSIHLSFSRSLPTLFLSLPLSHSFYTIHFPRSYSICSLHSPRCHYAQYAQQFELTWKIT